MSRIGSSANASNSSRRYNLPTFQCPSLIMVEGSDEFHFFRVLMRRNDVQIHVYEGKNQLQLELQTMMGIEGYDRIKRVAIVRDADDDPAGATQSVLMQWANAVVEAVPKVTSDQWFDDRDGRQWSVWIMPDSGTKGDLEELLWQAVDETDHRACVDGLIDCLENCRPVPFGSKTKARLYSWLSTQRDPLKELHAALKPEKRLFDPADLVFSRFALLIDNL